MKKCDVCGHGPGWMQIDGDERLFCSECLSVEVPEHARTEIEISDEARSHLRELIGKVGWTNGRTK